MVNRALKKAINLLFIGGMALTAFYVSSNVDISSRTINKNDVNNDSKGELTTINTKSLLFLSAYSPRWSPTVDQIKGMKDSLYSYVSVTEEYMDTKNIPYTDTRKVEIYNILKTKYANTVFDYIVVADDDALSFMMEYHDELFDSTPVIFEGINSQDLASSAVLKSYCTGIVERVSYGKNIEFTHSLLPDATKINVICDSTATSVGELNQFMTEATPYPEFEYNFINTSTISTANFKTVLNNMTDETINIYLEFSETSEKHYDQDERFEFVRNNLNAPMFRASSMGIGDCFVGGYVYSHFHAGKMAGGIVDNLINGMDISKIQVNLASFSSYTLDYKLFNKYKLNESNIPSDETVTWLNRDLSFYEQNKVLVIVLISVSAFVVLFLIFIIIVSLQLRKKNKSLTDINKKLKETQEEIDKMSKTDYLTGLNNPREFHRSLSELIKDKKEFYLMIVDVDNFKSINDLFGHEIGDKVLVTVAGIFTNFTSKRCLVYRFGGDEFAFILNDYSFLEADSLADHINSISKSKINVDSNSMNVNFSIGIAHSEPADTSETEVIARADSAMYYVKQSRKNGHAFYNHLTMKSVNESVLIANELEKAIDNNRVYMLFQPLYYLKEKKFLSMEALMRVSDFNFGPGDFIPVAEHSNLIIKLGRIALKQSIAFKGELDRAGFKDVKMEINFSAAQIGDELFFSFFDNECEKNNVSPEEIIFELTETVYFKDNDFTKELIQACQRRGIELALDDFGSGYSSINSLSRINYRYVKFDKTIIDSMFDDLSIRNLISFCHTYNCLVVAEGVERKDQSNYLKKEKCDIIQGFYYSKPIDKESAYKLITGKKYPSKKKETK